MKQVLLDQGLPFRAAMMLRKLGWEAVHVRELGMQGAPDVEILEHAAREAQVIVTLDRDFPEILALTAAVSPPVILVRQQRLCAAELAALVGSVWQGNERVLAQGCVLKVSARGTRVRLLPLK